MRRPGPIAAAWRLLLCVVLVVSSSPIAVAQANPASPANDAGVAPRHYRIALNVDPADTTFSGRERVTLAIQRTLTTLRLDVRGLQIASALLSRGATRRPLLARVNDAEHKIEMLPADGEPIEAGEWELELEWSGRTAANAQGLYRIEQRFGGLPFTMLATQMQPTFARSVFPCFDRPDLKATFDIKVSAPAGYDVVSNMPVVDVEPESEGRRSHRFATTPPMATYLVALAVGRFDVLREDVNGLALRLLAAPGRAALGRYALDTTKRLLPYFGTYFGVPYRLPKLDQLAVPAVRNGAMEDWGLISYAEDLVLSADDDGTEARRRIFSTVAHEVSHQWFGNLVTPLSWEDLWLNESFATWMAAKAAANFNPAWHMAVHDRVPLDRALLRDSNAAARALLPGPVDERNVFGQFNLITYTKGSAIIAMLESWIGEEAFQKGIAAYIDRRSFGSASAAALWAELGHQSGQDVAAVAQSWLRQPGFPVVQVDTRCSGDTTLVTLRQRRFQVDGRESDQTWMVPLVIRADGVDHPFLLREREARVELPTCAALLQLNAAGTAFYRTAYPPALTSALAAAMSNLPAQAQITLLSDVFALAQSGDMPLSAYYELAAKAMTTTSPARLALVNQVRVALAFVEASLRGSAAHEPARATARRLLRSPLASIGWQPASGDDAMTHSLRGGLIRDLAFYEDGEAIAFASAAFDAGTLQPGDYLNGIIAAVGRHPSERQFATLMRRLEDATTEDARQLYANAVSASVSRRDVDAVLKLAIGGSLPPNIAASLPGRIGLNGAHADAAYEYVIAHFRQFADLAGEQFAATNELLPSIARGFNQRAAADRLLADQARLLPQGGPQAAQMAARIRLMDDFRARELPRLLQGQSDGSAARSGLSRPSGR